jgi:thymidylate kinase
VTGIGSLSTKLIVIRGNSGAGKSTIAKQIRLRFDRQCALVEQDYLRRIVLRELDQPGGIAPMLIAETVRFALDHDRHVVLEGILHAARYGAMIRTLLEQHLGANFVFYLDVSFEETLRRHTTRPQANEFTADDMRSWYAPRDLLGVDGEHVVPESSALEDTVDLIGRVVGAPNPAILTQAPR